jgi:Rrf2 family transcriptional regulator, iron-sulfur cluster assembly transcription factor
MMSKTTLQAVQALAIMAELPEGQYEGAGSIAKRIGAAQNYLGKLLQTLAREGLVVSQKGLGGGFRLARHPSEISLFDVAEPFEHLSRWTGCFLGRPNCSGENPCAVHYRWAPLRDSYLNLLRGTSILDVVGKKPVAASA